LYRADLAVGLVASLLALLMFGATAWLVATAVGVYLWAASGDDVNLRSAAVVLLALAFNALWAPNLFEMISAPLLWADTALVWAALSLMQTGFTWRGTIIESPGHAIAIFGPCSSFHNMSLGLLCWIALTKLARPQWVRSDVYVGLAIVAAVLCMNTMRVYLMALSPAMYSYWHDGAGAEVFAWSVAAVVLAISLATVLRTPVRQ
jgi:Transmembrane exosortase (Exosortase_EpsH)